jgi:IS30 family transposase
MLGHLGRERNTEALRDSLLSTVSELPASLRCSLTWDQGAEMNEYRAFGIATDFDVYFADPDSPWQRGSNKNLNGLICDNFPKGTNFNGVSDDATEALIDRLNNSTRIFPMIAPSSSATNRVPGRGSIVR